MEHAGVYLTVDLGKEEFTLTVDGSIPKTAPFPTDGKWTLSNRDFVGAICSATNRDPHITGGHDEWWLILNDVKEFSKRYRDRHPDVLRLALLSGSNPYEGMDTYLKSYFDHSGKSDDEGYRPGARYGHYEWLGGSVSDEDFDVLSSIGSIIDSGKEEGYKVIGPWVLRAMTGPKDGEFIVESIAPATFKLPRIKTPKWS
ncbi:hypothetical protein GCM10027595_05700 [Corynebacterium nasicanis]